MGDVRETLSRDGRPFEISDLAFGDRDGRRVVSFAAVLADVTLRVEDASTLSEQLAAMFARRKLPELARMRASRWRVGANGGMSYMLESTTVRTECLALLARNSRPTAAEVSTLARAYLAVAGNEVGGSLRVVLSDKNVRDNDVTCCGCAARDAGDRDGELLAFVLHRCTRTQRLEVARRCWDQAHSVRGDEISRTSHMFEPILGAPAIDPPVITSAISLTVTDVPSPTNYTAPGERSSRDRGGDLGSPQG